MKNAQKRRSALGVWGLLGSSAVENPPCVEAELRLTADKPEMVCQHSDYRGPLGVILANLGEAPYRIAHRAGGHAFGDGPRGGEFGSTGAD